VKNLHRWIDPDVIEARSGNKIAQLLGIAQAERPGGHEGADLGAYMTCQCFRQYVKSGALLDFSLLNEEAKKQPNHPGIAHYLIHSYDFAPLAAMCVSTAHLYDKIASASPHALHMPSHVYSMLGLWEDSIRSNLGTKVAADDYAAKNYPDRTHPIVPHLLGA
jgi:hypothetical protein